MEACGGGGDMGFQQEVCNPVASCDSISMAQETSVVMTMSSMPAIHKPSGAHHDPFFGPGWDPISSMTQNHQNFGCPPMVPHRDFANFHFPPPIPLWESQGINPQPSHYPPPGSSFDEMVPRAQCFMSQGLPDMVGPMGLPQCGLIANPGPSYAANVDGSAMQGMRNTEGETMASPSSEKRRKRTPESSSPYESNKNNEGDLQKDPSGDASDVQKEQNEKKQKTEQTESGNSRGKQTKDDSNSQEPPKENYIHVRARRGQATNSHSLAERVRREKISERMKMLQELVPGCNKITGKAVMLDEIINYVQSLQQQVEFLSMKLATLLPDLSVDLERVLSKEILQAHGRDALARGLGPGTSLPLPYNNTLGILPRALPSTSQYPPLPQATLSNDFQTLFQMGFDSNSAIDMLKQNGRLKPEQ